MSVAPGVRLGSYEILSLIDGQRFLIPRPESTAAAETTSPIVVVLNWADEIRK